MADEARTPEEVTQSWMERQGLAVGTHLAADDVAALAALIREERELAFTEGADAGQQAERGTAWASMEKVLGELKRRHRLAVEGRSDG